MLKSLFVNRCIRETLNGLREGLSLFSGESRAAVIYNMEPGGELLVCDPGNLLRGYEPKLHEIYFERGDWCTPVDESLPKDAFNYIESQPNLQLDGLISFGGSSRPVYYQMWFTEHHPNICSLRPTERWLEHAVLRFSHDMANDAMLYTGISGNFLKEYSTHAVRDCIIDLAEIKLGLDVKIRVYPVLDAIIGICKTSEEGARAYGAIAFVEPRFHSEIKFLARFVQAEQPLLSNYKHVRKLLQAVEHSDRTLISDGQHIIGVAPRNFEEFHILADFQGKFGFLSAGDELVCSFQDGTYSSDTHRAKLFEVEEALLDYELEPSIRTDMFKIITALVHNAEDQMFGCSFVIDLAKEITPTAGQMLTPAIDLRKMELLRLAAAFSKVDGALHIRSDLHLHAFACLLDGHHVPNENRARGARYNSALRFTAQHQETIVVVVSSDRPVSIFQQGREIINRFCHAQTTRCNLYPLPLDVWLKDHD